MQLKNWNDARYLLALKRGGTLSSAAKLLGVDDTTVSRRLAVLQGAATVPLYSREADGRLRLSDSGEMVATLAENIEHQVEQIDEIFGAEQQSCSGVVRITSVPVVINQILTPAAGPLLTSHPALQLELFPDSRDLSLAAREADLAIRLARPTAGGHQIKVRKLGELSSSVFALRKYSPTQVSRLPWIGYDDELSHIAPQRWMKKQAAGSGQRLSALRVHDVETALQATLAGLGRTVLPDAIAASDVRLRVVDGAAPPARELWLLSHTRQTGLNRISTVVDWLNMIFTD